MTLLLVYASISIFVSFLCSVLEAALLSATPTFINVKKGEGKTWAAGLEQLKLDVDKPLIAILTLNTVAHTVGAILVGVQAEITFGSGNNMVGIVSAIMTILILVVSEIIPKTIGATYWKQLAYLTTKILNIIILPLKWTGILWLMQLLTRIIGKDNHISVLSRADFTAMTDLAEQKGVFSETESRIIKNLLSFKTVQAKDIMTPRTIVKLAPQDQTIEEFININTDLGFSRIPVYDEQPDRITGYILKDEIYKHKAEKGPDRILEHFKRPIPVVNRNTGLFFLFDLFIQEKEHIAVVVDEYGSLNGVITMEDIIETLLGLEIMDENDTSADLQQLARKHWEQRAKRMGLL